MAKWSSFVKAVQHSGAWVPERPLLYITNCMKTNRSGVGKRGRAGGKGAVAPNEKVWGSSVCLGTPSIFTIFYMNVAIS